MFYQKTRDNMTEIVYIPTESHETLYRKIDAMICEGYHYSYVAKHLAPTLPISSSRQQVWKLHKKNEFTKDNHIRMAFGLPRYVERQETELADPCPRCGIAHTYDCTVSKLADIDARVTQPNTKPRKRAPRVEIPLSDPAAARAKLERKLKEYHSGLSEL